MGSGRTARSRWNNNRPRQRVFPLQTIEAMVRMSAMGKRERYNLAVSATAEVLDRIDALVEASPVDTSRSGIALAAIREGLPAVEARIMAATKAKVRS